MIFNILLHVQIAFIFYTANNELDYSTGSPYPGINGASIHPKKDAPFDEARWKENSAKGNIFRRIMPHAQQKLTAVNVDPLIVDLKSTENYGHRFPKSPGISRNAIFVGKLQKYWQNKKYYFRCIG